MSDEMRWDLSPLVENTDPGKIQEQINQAITDAKKLEKDYKGKITSLDPKGVLELYKRQENAFLKREGAIRYAQLNYSADMTDPVSKDLNDHGLNAFMEIQKTLAFIDLELGKLLKKNPKLIENPILTDYKHALEQVYRKVPYQLSEIEEKLIIEKDRNGIDAWSQLQEEWVSTRTFEIEIDGKMQTLPYGKIIGFYDSPDRKLRKNANSIIYSNLGKDHIIWASALRSICSDHIMQMKRRKWPSTLTSSLITNDVDQASIESLMETVKTNASLYQRYLSLKAKIMGLPKLGNWDITAPLPEIPERTFTWSEGQKLVVDCYSSFDKQSGEWVQEMFEKRHIDGIVKQGKQTGAWCAPWVKGKSAWILLSFNEKLGNVYTLAHENGHALHDYLMTRAQKPTNCSVSYCMAEIGSVFGELLLTEKLLAEAKTNEEKREILCHVLDDFGITAFQVSARYFFEHRIYDSIQKGEFLDGEKIAKLWVTSRDEIYGNAVEWLEEMKWEWTMKGHYYIPRFRFYNYPYVYAQLFVFALYEKYKQEGEAFVPKLKQLLASGSSKSPRDLVKEIGFDLTDPNFWKLGLKQAERLIDELETLV
ncbi:MAG: M3 family oligoendopeptidase [Candidatus Hodarchaeota archaeon]